MTFLQVVNACDRADDGCCAASASLFECGEFLFGDLATFYLHAQVGSQLLKAAVGDRGKNGLRLRSDVGVVLDAEEVGSATFVDVFLFLK